MKSPSLGFAAMLLSSASFACWTEAGSRYGIAPALLYGVASAESDLRANAVNWSHSQRTGSHDIGLMQINSSHLPRLARLGISERDLLDPCTNIRVGAWLLADLFAKQGVSWDAVGAYNAVCTKLRGDACTAARRRYAWRVYARLIPSGRPAPNTRKSSSLTRYILSARVSP